MVKRIGALVLSMVLGLSMLLPLSGCSSEAYVPQGKAPTISTPVIGKEGALRVGVDANNSPFSGQTSSGIVGLNVDIAAAIADEFGLKLEIVDVGSNPVQALEGGTVDIVMGVDKADSSSAFWRSDAYIQSAVALFSATPGASIPAAGSGTKIAAQTSSMSAWEVNKQFGENSLVAEQDLKTAFSDLGSGTVGFVAADAVIGTFAAYQNSVGASIVALLQKPNGYAVGVLDSNDELKRIISDTLVLLADNGMISLIETKWLGRPIDLGNVPLTEGAQASSTNAQSNDAEGGPNQEGAEQQEGEGDGVQADDADQQNAEDEAGANAVQRDATDATQ